VYKYMEEYGCAAEEYRRAAALDPLLNAGETLRRVAPPSQLEIFFSQPYRAGQIALTLRLHLAPCGVPAGPGSLRRRWATACLSCRGTSRPAAASNPSVSLTSCSPCPGAAHPIPPPSPSPPPSPRHSSHVS
jgi:hypothetical protein